MKITDKREAMNRYALRQKIYAMICEIQGRSYKSDKLEGILMGNDEWQRLNEECENDMDKVECFVMQPSFAGLPIYRVGKKSHLSIAITPSSFTNKQPEPQRKDECDLSIGK